ncbi:Arc family DNA-binding protein [Brucella rhizosphaerae]|uniref:Arc family DNA-binding protein n=1 Tax=Brucella rhizosphaerae TaxID=571254 RepID=UPI0004B9BF58|nr:Arc family DNA-binding protein [Brucella rhizosphaerae]
MKTGRESDKFPLRLPDGMRDIIRKEADRNNRSMNAEIVYQLHHFYMRSETQKADAVAS